MTHASTSRHRGPVIGAGLGLGLGVGVGLLAGIARWRRGGARWVADGGLVEGRSEHVAVLLGDGSVLVAGGHAPGDQILASVERRDPAGGWAPAAPMSTPRASAAAVRLADGRALVVGGWTPAGATAEAEVFDPATGAWSATAAMTHPRAGHAVVRLGDGTVLVAGGGTTAGFPTTAERYDPVSAGWSPAGELSVGRKQLATARLHDGTVLAAGGDGAGDLGTTVCERYHPATGSWTVTGALTVERSHDEGGGFTATLLADGRVLVVGGFRLADGAATYLDSAEAYDPAGGVWAGLASLPGPGRVHAAAVTLADGRGLVVGGWTGDQALAQTAAFEPATGSWAVLPSLQTARAGHTATLLPAGDVLVVGGLAPHVGGFAIGCERLVVWPGCAGGVLPSGW